MHCNPYALLINIRSFLAVLGTKLLHAWQLSTHCFLHPSCLLSVGRLHNNVAWFWFGYTTYFRYMSSICTVHEHMAISGCPGTAMAKTQHALQLSTHYCFHPCCLLSVGRLHNVAWFWFWYTTNFHYMPSICTLHEHMAISGCPGTATVSYTHLTLPTTILV